ncbi:unnamed protein product [Adineta ricciae]|uniref:Peptidase S1 domain-containing protein n=1 Tax=Adineta ricciae TaxID=249248 RepID=A0A816DA55_ADIRI|nr:unnamed protein product [Adineta ricciae]CAF1635460.1 unnamed protein product [Adineta ricciae]
MLLLIGFLAFVITSISATTYSCDSTAPCGCSTTKTTSVIAKIVGGENAMNYTWNWMVSLQYQNSHICGASLITSEYAVTAAHCLEDYIKDLDNLSIRVGSNIIKDTTTATIQRRKIIKATIHPDYKGTDSNDYSNDIGIIQFAPLNTSTSSKINFICLPSEGQDPFQVNTSLVAIGWGVTYESQTAPISNYLLQVTVQVYSSSSDVCQASPMTNSTVQFCAGVAEGGKDTCQGDSGGPLMAFVNNRWILAGITSAGNGCARVGQVGLYTRVSQLISFINSLVNLTVPSTISELTTTTTTATTSFNMILTHNITGLNGTIVEKNTAYTLEKSISISLISSVFLFFITCIL